MVSTTTSFSRPKVDEESASRIPPVLEADLAALQIITDALKLLSPSWSGPPSFEFTGEKVKIKLLPNRRITGTEVQDFATQIHRAAGNVKFQFVFPAGYRPVGKPREILSPENVPSNKHQKSELLLEIGASLPKEVELLRPYFYQLGPTRNKARIVILRVHVVSKKGEDDLQAWKDNFQKTHNILILVSRARRSSGVVSIVNDLGGTKNRILTARDIPAVSQSLNRIVSTEPLPPPPSKSTGQSLRFKQCRFQAWDYLM